MKLFKLTVKTLIYIALLGAFSFCSVLVICYLQGPPDITADPITVFYNNEGEPIGNKTKLEQKTSLDQIAPYAVDATIVIEDKHFYKHHGFDLRGIARAVLKNIKTGTLKEGASTITQQYARNLYLSHEKTWIRKIKEALYTIRLEMFYSKEEILNGYLNTIYYGHGAYGISEASQIYYDKNAKDLTLAEAAMLAGVPKGPTYYSPFNDKDKAFTRQGFILKQMLYNNLITQAEYYTATSETLEFSEPYTKTSAFAQYFKDTALKEAANILKEDSNKILTSGYKIYTTLDAKLQSDTEEIVQHKVPEDSQMEIGVITLEPEDGAIRSLIGGRDYTESVFNRATDAKRMVGSAFKPILYYAALEHGYTASTMLMSEPTSFVMANGNVYEPSNFNGYYAYKPITLAQALALSDNIYAVKTNLFLDPKQVVKTAEMFGISGNLPSVPSLALGSASISLLEMTEAYGVIANGGKEVNGYTVTKIINQQGKVIYRKKNEDNNQLLNEDKAFILAHLMTGMFDRRLNGYMEVTGSSVIDKLSRLYAGKSGTTDSDNWMIGFSPTTVTAVWTGYDQNKPIQKPAEKRAAKEVWAESIEAAHKGKPVSSFKVPEGIVKKLIDPESGQIASKNCPIARTTYFEKGTEPTEVCQIHTKKKQDKKAPNHKPFWKKVLDILP